MRPLCMGWDKSVLDVLCDKQEILKDFEVFPAQAVKNVYVRPCE